MTEKRIEAIVVDYAGRYPGLIGCKEAAQIAGVPLGTVYNWSSQNRLDDIKTRCGRHIRFDRDGFVRLLANGSLGPETSGRRIRPSPK